MDLGSLVLGVAVGLVAGLLVVLAILRERRARLGEVTAEQVPELLRAENARFSGYARPGGPEAR